MYMLVRRSMSQLFLRSIAAAEPSLKNRDEIYHKRITR